LQKQRPQALQTRVRSVVTQSHQRVVEASNSARQVQHETR
jgi:hypothetical protein